jgi:hypothetical protein
MARNFMVEWLGLRHKEEWEITVGLEIEVVAIFHYILNICGQLIVELATISQLALSNYFHLFQGSSSFRVLGCASRAG